MKPWLLLPVKLAHDISSFALNGLTFFMQDDPLVYKPLSWKGLYFSNRFGTAGGMDKNGKNIQAWQKLGCGFVEVGTVTPLPQKANNGKIIARDINKQLLWNQMGFPNHGAEALRNKLAKFVRPHRVPIFINIGKNRNTPLDRAAIDYCTAIQTLNVYADVFVINISSPNTQGLRDLQCGAALNNLLNLVISANHTKVPLLLKLSPDLDASMFDEILAVSLQNKIDGWILTNTTTARDGLGKLPVHGGIAGKPLAEKSRFLLERAVQFRQKNQADVLIVSVGGILNEHDIKERLAIGADLIQVYSALVFSGPYFFRNVIAKMQKQDSLRA